MSSMSSDRCDSSAAGSPVSMNGNIVAPVPSVALFWLFSDVRQAVRMAELVDGDGREVRPSA